METTLQTFEQKIGEISSSGTKEKREGAVIPLLQSAQETYGYIKEDSIYRISEITGVPVSDIFGVITFYSQFRLKPLGKNVIKICEGTACHVNGANMILNTLIDELEIEVGETTPDGLFSVQSVACLGCCSLAPVIMINENTYGNLAPDKIRKIIKQYRDGK